jgi:DNA-binding transcriptional regulator GbsR (MarR family)
VTDVQQPRRWDDAERPQPADSADPAQRVDPPQRTGSTQPAGRPGPPRHVDSTQSAQPPGPPPRTDTTQPAQRDDVAVRRFIERFASLLNESGLPPMPARIFVALLAADSSRLTATELADQLGVSPAAVSGGVRYLIQVGMVSREGEPGSRRHYYRIPDRVWPEYLRVRDQIVMRWASLMREGADVLGADTPAGERLADSAMFFDFVSKELPAMLSRWDEYKDAHQD